MKERKQLIRTEAGGTVPYFDALRSIAIAMVIMLHVVSGVSDTIPGQMTEVQLKVYEIIKTLSTPGVPIFLMISGAIFLAPGKEMTLKKLFCKYIRRIFLALVLFGTFYAFLELAASEKIMPVLIWKAFCNMLSGNSWAHMWYLYMFLGIYLMLPFLKVFMANAGEKTVYYTLTVLFVANSLLPFLTKSFGFSVGIVFPTAGIYLFYYLWGGLHTCIPCRKQGKKTVFAISLSGVAAIAIIVLNTSFSWGLDIQYDSPIIVCLSMSIFLLVKAAGISLPVCTSWRRYYFTIYLIHTFFLNLSYKVLRFTPLAAGGYILIPVFWAAVFALSLLGAWILMKLPFLRKYVL